MRLTALLLTTALGGFAGPLFGQRGAPPLQPTDYRSAAGDWVLHVDPSQRLGAGRADYRLSRDGMTVWGGELKVTLRDAVVAEDGTFGGYAYSRGPEAVGSFHVLVVRADGEVLCDDRSKRRPTNQIHGTPNPKGAGVHLQDASATMVVRLVGLEEGGSQWRRYRMSDGERLLDMAVEEPAEPDETIYRVVDVRSVPGADLLLLKRKVWVGKRQGSVFFLVDALGVALWRSPFLERRREERDGRRSSHYAGFLPAEGRDRFAYSDPLQRERVECSITRREDGGREVRELGRTPLGEAPSEVTEPLPEPRPIELAYLGATDLGDEPAAEQELLENVVGLGFTDDGLPELIVWREDVFWYLSLDEEGRVADEIELALAEGDGVTSWYESIGDRWFRAFQTRDAEPTLRIDAIDVRSGAVTALYEERDAELSALDGDGDGGFVLVSSGDERLIACDGNGGVRWSWSKDDVRENLHPMRDVAVTGDAVVTLSGSRGLLQVFALDDGAVRGTVELRDAWGREPSYAVHVFADGVGGVVVPDDERLWRTSPDGELLQVVEPHLPDGEGVFASRFHARRDGSLWGWNRRWGVLFELDERGVARPFGRRLPEQDELSKPGWASIDHTGRIFVQDSATGSLHAFDVEGRRLFVCRPQPNDFPRLWGGYRMAFDDGGHVYVPTEGEGLFDWPRHVRFDERGRRLGFEELGSSEVRFVPGSDERWIYSHGTGFLRKGPSSGKSLQKILRRPDRRWYTGDGDFDVGSDGSLVFTDWLRERGDPGLAVCLHDPDGSPRQLFPLGEPAGDVTLSRDWIALHRGNTAYLLRIDDPEWGEFDLAPGRSPETRWRLGFSPDGSELWAVEAAAARLHRWQLPD